MLNAFEGDHQGLEQLLNCAEHKHNTKDEKKKMKNHRWKVTDTIVKCKAQQCFACPR